MEALQQKCTCYAPRNSESSFGFTMSIQGSKLKILSAMVKRRLSYLYKTFVEIHTSIQVERTKASWRKKTQSPVTFVNDKQKLRDVRQKANENRDLRAVMEVISMKLMDTTTEATIGKRTLIISDYDQNGRNDQEHFLICLMPSV